jgi:hypothetical protein
MRLYWKNTDIEADIFRKGTGLRFSFTWLVRIFMKIAKENFRSPRKFERLRRSVSQRANLKNSIARKKNRTHFKCDTFFPTFFPTLISAKTRYWSWYFSKRYRAPFFVHLTCPNFHAFLGIVLLVFYWFIGVYTVQEISPRGDPRRFGRQNGKIDDFP